MPGGAGSTQRLGMEKRVCCPVALCRGTRARSVHALIHNYFLFNLPSCLREIIPFGAVGAERLLLFLIKWGIICRGSQVPHGQSVGDSMSGKDALLET